VGGLGISCISFAAIALHMTPQTEFGTFVPLLAVNGVGQAMLLVPLLVGVLSAVPPADAPKASSFISLSIQLGGSIASTMLITILDRRTSLHSDIYRGLVTHANPLLHATIARPGGLAAIANLLRQQATNAGFADAIFCLVPVAAAGVVLALFLGRAPRAAHG
jgi:hypothetical protein